MYHLVDAVKCLQVVRELSLSENLGDVRLFSYNSLKKNRTTSFVIPCPFAGRPIFKTALFSRKATWMIGLVQKAFFLPISVRRSGEFYGGDSESECLGPIARPSSFHKRKVELAMDPLEYGRYSC